MINRYQGNSGRVTRVEDPSPPRVRSEKPDTGSVQPPPPRAQSHNGPGRRTAADTRNGSGIQNMLSQLGRLLPGGAGKMAALETEDIILLLILYLMYRESGDSELLMMMGAMFLL